MATNLYFNNVTSNVEQDLINDLTSEVIQIHGMDVFYIPRIIVKEDLLLDEDVLSRFEVAYEIEMYIKGTEGFGGEGDLVSKFGLDVRDEVIFTVHKDRFELATTKPKPLEGDLIFLPMSKGLFEIKFVEHEQPFYQAGKNYSFDITCELFQYSEEQFEKGVPEVIRDIEREQSAAIDFVMTAGGSGAYAIDESVYQGASLAEATAKGTVVSWTTATRTLRTNDTSGTFVAGASVYGATSSAVWSLTSYDDQALPTTPFADNLEFETEADAILDFSESNPFGEVT